jgi:hypothetical protein
MNSLLFRLNEFSIQGLLWRYLIPVYHHALPWIPSHVAPPIFCSAAGLSSSDKSMTKSNPRTRILNRAASPLPAHRRHPPLPFLMFSAGGHTLCTWSTSYSNAPRLISPCPPPGPSTARRLRPAEFAGVSGPGMARRGPRCLAEGHLGRCRITLASAIRAF